MTERGVEAIASERTLAALVERRLADTLGKATAAPAIGCPRRLVDLVRRTRVHIYNEEILQEVFAEAGATNINRR